MKEKILRIGKVALPILTLFLYCSTFIEIPSDTYPYPVTALNMLLSVLFILSYVLFLWVYRKNETVLWLSLTISAVWGILVLIQLFFPAFLLNSKLPTAINDLVVTPFNGLTFWAQNVSAYVILLYFPMIVLATYKVVLLVLLKSNILKKKEENQ